VLLDQPQQMALRNVIFQAEVVEQRFRLIDVTFSTPTPDYNI
jgi:hypothetical protein